MDNVLLFPKTPDALTLSSELGFTQTLFAEDVVIITGSNKKEILAKATSSKARGKKVIFIPSDEELLRYALERVPVDIILGVEQIHAKDSVHHVRGGLDQVLCTIAREQGKIIGFSFSSILNSENRVRLLARMRFNIELCKKYKVNIFFGNFSGDRWEIRGKKDLQAFGRVLGF